MSILVLIQENRSFFQVSLFNIDTCFHICFDIKICFNHREFLCFIYFSIPCNPRLEPLIEEMLSSPICRVKLFVISNPTQPVVFPTNCRLDSISDIFRDIFKLVCSINCLECFLAFRFVLIRSIEYLDVLLELVYCFLVSEDICKLCQTVPKALCDDLCLKVLWSEFQTSRGIPDDLERLFYLLVETYVVWIPRHLDESCVYI